MIYCFHNIRGHEIPLNVADIIDVQPLAPITGTAWGKMHRDRARNIELSPLLQAQAEITVRSGTSYCVAESREFIETLRADFAAQQAPAAVQRSAPVIKVQERQKRGAAINSATFQVRRRLKGFGLLFHRLDRLAPL